MAGGTGTANSRRFETPRVAWNEEWVGTDQVRSISIEGGRLVINTPPIKNPISGELAIATLVFERSK